jgi:hypothetical protein
MIRISKQAIERLEVFEQSSKERLFRIFISGIG